MREYTTLTWPQKDQRLFLLRKKLRKTLPTWSFPFPKEELNEFIVVEATSNWWACGITDDKSWLYKELRCNQFSCLFNYSESRSLILVHIDLIVFVFVLHLRASGPHGIFIQILIIIARLRSSAEKVSQCFNLNLCNFYNTSDCRKRTTVEPYWRGFVFVFVFFFYKKMYSRFAGRPNKSGRIITRWPYTQVAIRQGFAVSR